MVDFGAILNTIKGLKGKNEEHSSVPEFIIPFLPSWFQALPTSQQNILWSVAKHMISSGKGNDSSGASIIGAILGGESHENRPVAARGLQAVSEAHEQKGWAVIIAAAKAVAGNVNFDEWPFNDSEHGEECRQTAAQVQ